MNPHPPLQNQCMYFPLFTEVPSTTIKLVILTIRVLSLPQNYIWTEDTISNLSPPFQKIKKTTKTKPTPLSHFCKYILQLNSYTIWEIQELFQIISSTKIVNLEVMFSLSLRLRTLYTSDIVIAENGIAKLFVPVLLRNNYFLQGFESQHSIFTRVLKTYIIHCNLTFSGS